MGILGNHGKKPRSIGGKRGVDSGFRRRGIGKHVNDAEASRGNADSEKLSSNGHGRLSWLFRFMVSCSISFSILVFSVLSGFAAFKHYPIPEKIAGDFGEFYSVSMNKITSSGIELSFSAKDPDRIYLSDNFGGKIEFSDLQDGRQAFMFLTSLADNDFYRLASKGNVDTTHIFTPVGTILNGNRFQRIFEVNSPIDLREIFGYFFHNPKFKNVAISAINGRLIYSSGLDFSDLSSPVGLFDGLDYAQAAIFNKIEGGHGANSYFSRKMNRVDMKLYPGDKFIIAGEDGNIVVATSRHFSM